MKKVNYFIALLLLLWFGLAVYNHAQVERKTTVRTPADVMKVVNDSITNLASLNNLDSYSWLMSTFRTSSQKLYLLGSNNGIDWELISDSFLYEPNNSYSTVVRDPSIMYHNNEYWIAHTTNPFAIDSGFAIIKSNDLRNWEDVAFVDVSSICSDSSRVYAPDFFKDGNGDISIFVTVNPDTSKYAGIDWKFKIYELHPLNSEMTLWTEPVEVTGNFPESTIDAFMVKEGSDYYLWYSDLTTHLHIEYAKSTDKTSGFVVQENGDWAGWGYSSSWGLTEGESVVKIDDTTWRIYFDYFWDSNHQIYYSESQDTFQTWTTKQRLDLPFADFQHPTIIKTPSTKIAFDINQLSLSRKEDDFFLDTLRDNNNNLAIRYMVSSEGNDANDGKTWRTAKKTVNAVISELPKNLEGNKVYILMNKGELGVITLQNYSNGTIKFVKVCSDVTNTFFTNANNGDATYVISDDPVTFTGFSSFKVNGYVEVYAQASNDKAFGKIQFNLSDWGGMEINDFGYYDFLGVNFIQTAGDQFINTQGNPNVYISGCYADSYTTGKAFVRIGEKANGFWHFFVQSFDADYPNPYTTNTAFQMNDIQYLFSGATWYPRSAYTHAVLNMDKIGASGLYSVVGINSLVVSNLKIFGDITKLSIIGTESVIIQHLGNTIIKNLPTSAPTVSGALWRDSAAGNVVKVVP